jgi:hypothetical protein
MTETKQVSSTTKVAMFAVSFALIYHVYINLGFLQFKDNIVKAKIEEKKQPDVFSRSPVIKK